MAEQRYSSEVVIAGAGLAGLVAACELLDRGREVLILERGRAEGFGGLARVAFGGILMIDTPYQRRTGIRDDPELALRDWESYAEFTEEDHWPRAWARLYCEGSLEYIFHYLRDKGVSFLPVVNWPERGWHRPGNSVPRWHIPWGLGRELVTRMSQALEAHRNAERLTIHFEHEVAGLEGTGGRINEVHGINHASGEAFRAQAEHVVIASGGICGGDLSKVRAHWYRPWGEAPRKLLNGAHPHGDGRLHERVEALGGRLTHLDHHWHYAAGVHHPEGRDGDHGLSLVPPRSALWCNANGARIGPPPLVGYTDTRHLVETVTQQPGQYSWQVLNRRIAERELAVSGYDFMSAFYYKRRLQLLRELVFGNRALLQRLLRGCPEDFVTGDTVQELADKMNERSLYGLRVDGERLADDIRAWDAEIDRGPPFINDEQLRRILNARLYRGDRMRTCRFQKILEPRAGPLLAIREFIISRKSLGGIQTDLDSRVRDTEDQPIPGLYAIGEAAGFGGGGLSGKRSLEGTFLGGCVLTARRLGKSIAGGA